MPVHTATILQPPQLAEQGRLKPIESGKHGGDGAALLQRHYAGRVELPTIQEIEQIPPPLPPRPFRDQIRPCRSQSYQVRQTPSNRHHLVDIRENDLSNQARQLEFPKPPAPFLFREFKLNDSPAYIPHSRPISAGDKCYSENLYCKLYRSMGPVPITDWISQRCPTRAWKGSRQGTENLGIHCRKPIYFPA
jgi:hypothetical protein